MILHTVCVCVCVSLCTDLCPRVCVLSDAGGVFRRQHALGHVPGLQLWKVGDGDDCGGDGGGGHSTC